MAAPVRYHKPQRRKIKPGEAEATTPAGPAPDPQRCGINCHKTA